MIVSYSNTVTLIGGGEVTSANLSKSLQLAPDLVAADGGANRALELGHMPDAVIGDFDSVADAARLTIPQDRQFVISEQETTDFEKCLDHVDAPGFLAVGFLGQRVDHELAALNAIAARPEKRVILIGAHDIIFVAPPSLAMTLPEGSRFSLVPMGPVRGTSQGLQWPLEGIEFTPTGRIGTSNRVTGPVRVAFEGAPMLVILPIEALDQAILAV